MYGSRLHLLTLAMFRALLVGVELAGVVGALTAQGLSAALRFVSAPRRGLCCGRGNACETSGSR